MSSLNVIIAHQRPRVIERILKYWSLFVPTESILLAYGGSEPDFAAINHPGKMFIDDPQLRTRDHQRESQSYSAIFKDIAEWLEERPEFQYIQFNEFDHIPLITEFNEHHRRFLMSQHADVIGYQVRQIDGTSSPHYLYAASNSAVRQFLEKISVRRDRGTVLSLLGSSSCWTRSAFTAVANTSQPRVYLELAMATIAHHLGFRVCNAPADQQKFVDSAGDRTADIDEARAAGAWALHPVKRLFEKELPPS